MQANEIRIGNYIADSGGKVWQIDHWEYKDKVSAKPDEVEFLNHVLPLHPLTEYVNELKPVALTEKWLLGFGFKQNQWFSMRTYKKGNFEIIGCKDENMIFNVFVTRQDKVKLTSVHQLQNLYFALTGEELTLGDGIDCP